MPDPFDPTPAQPSPDGLASAHVDASTIALLAEVELDAAAIVELVRFLLDDDPDLPPNWHLAALLVAAEHVGSCPACSGVRAGIVGAAVAALAAPVPAGTVAARDAHLTAALAAFDGSIARAPYGDTEARAAGLDTVRTRRPWLRAPRAGLGVGPASGGPSAGAPSSTWAFARDRRVLLAVAVVLAISVPLVVNGGRRNRPAASKVADTTTAQTTVADTTAAAARSKAARPTGGVAAQAEGERIGDGLAEADTTSAGADQATTGAAPVIASADLRASASTVAVPAAPSAPLAAVSTTPVTTQPTVAPVTTPAPSTKSTATPLAARRSAVSTSRPSNAALAAAGTAIPAAARTGVLASADATENAGSKLVRDLGNLGSFTDEETALVAYAALGSAAPTGALAAKAPDVSAPAAAAAAAPAVSGADGRCLRALIGADTVAHADINGVAILIVSFSEPSPGHVQLLTAEGCAVRLDRTR